MHNSQEQVYESIHFFFYKNIVGLLISEDITIHEYGKKSGFSLWWRILIDVMNFGSLRGLWDS